MNKSNNNDSCSQDADADQFVIIGNDHLTSFNNWLCPESLHKIQTTSDPECRDVVSMCDELLETEEQMMREVSDFMFDHDTLNIRRSELLHHKWADRVYDPIRRHILSEISGKDFENLLLHKRLLYNAFLEKGNRKHYMSLETTEQPVRSDIPNLPLSLTARFGRLNDPLLLAERTRLEEDRIGMQCATGERLTSARLARLHLPARPLVPRARQDIGWKQWASMNVCDIESPEHQRKRLTMNPNKNQSQIAWDCYHRPCSDQEPPSSAVAAAAAAAATAGHQPCAGGHSEQPS